MGGWGTLVVKMDTKIVSIIVRRTPDDYTAIERTLCIE